MFCAQNGSEKFAYPKNSVREYLVRVPNFGQGGGLHVISFNHPDHDADVFSQSSGTDGSEWNGCNLDVEADKRIMPGWVFRKPNGCPCMDGYKERRERPFQPGT